MLADGLRDYVPMNHCGKKVAVLRVNITSVMEARTYSSVCVFDVCFRCTLSHRLTSDFPTLEHVIIFFGDSSCSSSVFLRADWHQTWGEWNSTWYLTIRMTFQSCATQFCPSDYMHCLTTLHIADLSSWTPSFVAELDANGFKTILPNSFGVRVPTQSNWTEHVSHTTWPSSNQRRMCTSIWKRCGKIWSFILFE